MSKLQQIGTLASKVLQAAMNSGLTWDESVSALGMAAKALADQAAQEGDGTSEDCRAHAKKRLEEGFAQPVRLVFARSDLGALKNLSEKDAKTLLENCNTKVFLKMPH